MHLHTCILYMYICIIHMLYKDMQHSRTRDYAELPFALV